MDRGRRPPPPGAPGRPAAARPLHRPGVRPPRPLPGLPGADATTRSPASILLGRLCLYGPRAARLHEELVPVTARWIEPSQRKQAAQPLRPGGRGEDARPARNAPCCRRSAASVDPVIQDKLREAAARDIAELLPHLEQRGRGARRGGRESLLAKRAEQEAKAMRTILEEQKKRVAETAGEVQGPAAHARLRRRRAAPARSQQAALGQAARSDRPGAGDRARAHPAIYEVKAQRIEPVGLVYLWPVTG